MQGGAISSNSDQRKGPQAGHSIRFGAIIVGAALLLAAVFVSPADEQTGRPQSLAGRSQYRTYDELRFLIGLRMAPASPASQPEAETDEPDAELAPNPTRVPVAQPRDASTSPSVAAAAIAPASIAATPATQPSACTATSMSAGALVLFDASNRERQVRGLAPLERHDCGATAARIRAEDMALRDYFSHEGAGGDTASSLLRGYGVAYTMAGENLARNNYPAAESAEVAFSALMESATHRDNILSPQFTHVGVASSEDGDGMTYYVMVFIAIAG